MLDIKCNSRTGGDADSASRYVPGSDAADQTFTARSCLASLLSPRMRCEQSKQ
uniref:Uncharacterized protein n=1 Tax=Picea glauca TaxID=3330 RepID=A0A117NIP3_PICGL|nr:hypothetical protein ABT39_MTgene38 [Picea glauca]